MYNQPEFYEREKLYKEVWAEPVTKVAERFNFRLKKPYPKIESKKSRHSGKRQLMGIKDCIGQGIESPSAILAPESTDPVGYKVKSLGNGASAMPALLYFQSS